MLESRCGGTGVYVAGNRSPSPCNEPCSYGTEKASMPNVLVV